MCKQTGASSPPWRKSAKIRCFSGSAPGTALGILDALVSIRSITIALQPVAYVLSLMDFLGDALPLRRIIEFVTVQK